MTASNTTYYVCVFVCCFFYLRPPEMGVPPPGKAVLSMSSLSHGVIRVDTEEKLAVLTLQDVGQVMPGGETEMVFMYIHVCVCVYIPFKWKPSLERLKPI